MDLSKHLLVGAALDRITAMFRGKAARGHRIAAVTGGEYRRSPRGNLIRTDLRGQLRRDRRRGEISPRQQRIAIKASRRGGVA